MHYRQNSLPTYRENTSSVDIDDLTDIFFNPPERESGMKRQSFCKDRTGKNCNRYEKTKFLRDLSEVMSYDDTNQNQIRNVY
jgi:hypothetical protein